MKQHEGDKHKIIIDKLAITIQKPTISAEVTKCGQFVKFTIRTMYSVEPKQMTKGYE